jgi:hypothetical protein
MRALAIEVGDSSGDFDACIVTIEDSVPFTNSSRVRPLKLSKTAFWIGLPGAMKCQSMPLSLHQASMALQVNSEPLSETIDPGLPPSAPAPPAVPGSTSPGSRPGIPW